MKFCFLFTFLVSMSLGIYASAGVEVGNGGGFRKKALPAAITCESRGGEPTRVEITPEASSKRAFVRVGDKDGWRSSYGTLQESVEFRDCCPPNHPASCGCDLLPTSVTQILVEDGSKIQTEFTWQSEYGVGYLKTAGKNIRLDCTKSASRGL